MPRDNPKCNPQMYDCEFASSGHCIILTDTNFKMRNGRKCPFYRKRKEKKGKRR